MTIDLKALSAKFSSPEYTSETRVAHPHAQILNSEGMVAIEVQSDYKADIEEITPGEQVNFDENRAIENGWETVEVKVNKDGKKVKLTFLGTSKPRMHVLMHKSIKVERNGREVYDRLMFVIFVDNNDVPLHDGFIQLRLRGRSAAQASFYYQYDALKLRDGSQNDCWLKNVWNIIPRANRSLQALFVFECEMVCELVGSSQKSEAARFVKFTPITEENIATMFSGIDYDGEDEDSKSATHQLIEQLIEDNAEEFYSKKANNTESTNNGNTAVVAENVPF